MKRITFIIVLILFLQASTSFAQNLGQQQKEIENIIRPELEAQIRQNMLNAQQNQAPKNQNPMQTRQGQIQTSQQQAVESYTSKMSIEGQIRMEQFNNPDVYIDRDITNRKSSAIIPDDSYNRQNQSRDIRSEPIHSENLNSKSLQSLRETSRDQISPYNNGSEMLENEIDWDREVYVQLFEKPKLQERPFVQKPDLVQWAWNEHARRMKLENEVAVRNDMIDLTKKGLGLVGGVLVKGSMSVGALLSANLNLYSELTKYWNECSSGVRMAKTSDTFEILGKAALNTLVDVAVPWVGNEAGVAYVGVEKMGTDGMRVFNSLQIGLSLSNFAVKNEKSEE